MTDRRIVTPMLMTAALAVLLTAALSGCGESKDLTACRQDNEMLTQQVAELEYQLSLADQAAAQAPAMPQAAATYQVVKGDTLWSIAQKQLGSGQRYKEILALNPQITQGTALTIGTTLKLPPR